MSNRQHLQDTLRNLLLAGAVVLMIMYLGPRCLPSAPKPGDNGGGVETPPRRTADSATEPVVPPPDVGTGEAVPQTPDASSGTYTLLESDEEKEVVIGAADVYDPDEASAPYRMRLRLSNVGASIVSARLPDHAERLKSAERYQLLSPVETEAGELFRSLAIEQINVDGEDIRLADARWQVRAASADGGDLVQEMALGDGSFAQRVEFYIDIARAGEPVLRLRRTFELPQQARKTQLHDLVADLVIENLSGAAKTVVVTYRGGLGVPRAEPRMDDRIVDLGVADASRGGAVSGRRETYAAVAGGGTVDLFSQDTAESGVSLAWAATGNKYFTCTVAPLGPDRRQSGERVASLTAVDLDGLSATVSDVTTRFTMSAHALAPGASLTYPAEIYIGAKDNHGFQEVDRYRARNYYFQLEQGYGWCTFTWLVELMIWLLNALYGLVGDFGVAIIFLVLVVRAALHPITKKGQVNMVRLQQRMSEFAPKMEEIKKRFANDKTRQQQEMMKLYREHNINPAGQLLTCLPMVIQMPIWVALYISLSNNVLMRHEGFLFTWIHDLTAQDCLIKFGSPIIVPIFGWELPCFNLLPILVAIFMYAQQKMQPKPKPNPNMTDQQRQQQEMMKMMAPMMSIMMLIIFYTMPSGLNLYIMASSLLGTIEQHFIRKHIRKHEDEGTLHKPAGKMRDKPGGKRKLSYLERLQKMAEEAQQQQLRRQKKGKS